MSVFHEWDNAIGAAGFRDALLAYGRDRGDIGPKGKLPKKDLKHLAAEHGVRPLPVKSRD